MPANCILIYRALRGWVDQVLLLDSSLPVWQVNGLSEENAHMTVLPTKDKSVENTKIPVRKNPAWHFMTFCSGLQTDFPRYKKSPTGSFYTQAIFPVTPAYI